MRVLLINTSEQIGGAAIAASRLLHALNHNGVETEMLVRRRQTDNPQVMALADTPLQRARFLGERGEIFLRNGCSRRHLFAIDTGGWGTDITRRPEFLRADVIHLHWVNQAMLSLRDIARICQSGKRVVWTMHDMWPFTALCHYADTCDGWRHGCGNCRLLQHPAEHDLSWRVYRRKEALFSRYRIDMVGCSRWLTDLAREAPLLRRQYVTHIANAIDTTRYAPIDGPMDRRSARHRLGLPDDRRLLLFVAYKVTDPKKGITYLRRAVARLCADRPEMADRLGIVAVGREAELLKGTFAVPLYGIPYVSETATMIDLYHAADALVMPTLMDNLPNTIVEAMACGLPCVGFNIGGLPQMISHEKDGYLVRYKDTDHLAECIERLLTTAPYDAIARAARRKAVKYYGEEQVADSYLRLYRRHDDEAAQPLT